MREFSLLKIALLLNCLNYSFNRSFRRRILSMVQFKHIMVETVGLALHYCNDQSQAAHVRGLVCYHF